MSTTNQSAFQAFFAHLSQAYPVSDALQEALTLCIQKDCLPPKSLLLREGNVCQRVYYIENGLARGFYLKNEEEITAWFMQEGDWMLAVSSFFGQKPSAEFIELLEETTLLSIHHQDLQKIYRQFPEFNYIGRALTEQYYVMSEERSWSLRRQTTLERYHQLLETNPELLYRAPLKYIASYLGMKPETFSRLRHKINGKDR